MAKGAKEREESLEGKLYNRWVLGGWTEAKYFRAILHCFHCSVAGHWAHEKVKNIGSLVTVVF